jgi:hypothetical protein
MKQKTDLFREKFGFYLEKLIPISLYLQSDINGSIQKSIKKSSSPVDYYTNESKMDLYIYSHETKEWQFEIQGIKNLSREI